MKNSKASKQEKIYGLILLGLALLYFWIDSPVIGG